MDTRWRIELLGGLRALQGDRVVTRFRTQQTGLLLAYLAYYPQRAHRREALIELLWPECEPEAGRHRLSLALSSLRQQLEPQGAVRGSVIVADRAIVGLNADATITDVVDFQAALKAAERAAGPAAVAGLAHTVELYQGELLPGYFEDWVLQERQWLAERFFAALGQLLAHLERVSDFARAVDYARRGVQADPLREEAHRDLIRLLAAAGQPAAARRQYEALERLLQEQLGAMPSAATRTLLRGIERLAVLRPQPASPPAHPPSAARVPGSAPPHAISSSEGENRLVTLLFAERSCALEMTRDLHPDEAAARINRLLQAMVDVLLKYEGRIDRFQGDGVLAVFGVPQAHEDDPERAIRAAGEIREAARHLGLAVTAGINSGEVYVGAVGSEQHEAQTVVGPAVNLASRLQGQAEPGQILVGETTYQLTRRAFEFSSLSLRIKGLTLPVTAYRVERAVPHPDKARGIEGLRAELIGRDEELAKLREALAAVLQGHGQMVSLIGEAGVGKSRLVAELKQVVSGSPASRVPGSVVRDTEDGSLRTTHSSPLLWLEGRSLELSMTASYSVFVDLFRHFFVITRGAGTRPEEAGYPERSDGWGARREHVVICLRELMVRGELPAERVDEMGPLLGNLLSLRFGDDWDLRLKNASPEQIKHQTFLAVRDFLLALTRRQPVILVLEDLHWADTLSLDLISLLMEALPRASLLLLCLYRPEHEHKCWRLGSIASQKCAGRYTELHLRELAPDQSRRLVETLLTVESLPAPVKELILEKSRGNPFYLEEVVRSLIDLGLLYREGEVWRAHEEIDSVTVPESVQSVILSRVDRLRPELKHLLQRAAVIGRLFRRRVLEQFVVSSKGALVSEEDRLATGLEAALWEMEERALIYQERVVPEEEYSFKHVLTQETIYQSLLRRQRTGLHQSVAEALEALYPERLEEHCEQLAYHYERSGVDKKAIEYLLQAGEKARRAYLNEEAIAFFQRALQRLDAGARGESRRDRRLEALKGLGRVYHGIGKEGEAAECFRQAIALGREISLASRELVRLYWWLGDVLWWQSRYDEMIRIGEEGLALLGGDTQSVEAVLINATVSAGYGGKGNKEKSEEFGLRNVPILQRLPYSEELRTAYDKIFWTYANEKNVEEAARWLCVLERKAEQQHDLRALGEVYERLGRIIAGGRGDLRGAVAHLQRALELSVRIADEKHTGAYLRPLGETFLRLGELQQAEESARKACEVAERVGNKSILSRSYQLLGTVALCLGRWEEAGNAFRTAARLFRESYPPMAAWATYALGRGCLAQGKRQEAVGHFQASAVALSTTGLVWPIAAMSDLSVWLSPVVSGLDEASEDAEAFRAFCRCVREEHPEVAAPFVQWYLEPIEPGGQPSEAAPAFHDPFAACLAPEWVWQDPLGDCSFTVQDGLEIRAANGRDLWDINQSAPRLLQTVSGEFAAQTVCSSIAAEKPTIGGLLLWKDRQNFCRLDSGTRGPYEISFSGCLENHDHVFGRGRLPSERITLRLERREGHVNALCSPDGQEWFTVGHVSFPFDEPLEVGLHAIGEIDRLIYPGAYAEGTAIRFESFRFWTRQD